MNTTLYPKPAALSRRSQPIRWPRPTPTHRPPPPTSLAHAKPAPVQPSAPATVPRPSSSPRVPTRNTMDTIPDAPAFDTVDETTLELEEVGGETDDDDDDRPTLECVLRNGLATTWELPDPRSVDTAPPTRSVTCPGCQHHNARLNRTCTTCGHPLGRPTGPRLALSRLPPALRWAPVALLLALCASLLAAVAIPTATSTLPARQPVWSAAHGTPVTVAPAALLRTPIAIPAAPETRPTPVAKTRVAPVKTHKTHKIASTPKRTHPPTARPHKPTPKSQRNKDRLPRRPAR